MQEINFEDIRKGDRIRATTYQRDHRTTVEGIAHHKDEEGGWVTRWCHPLASPECTRNILLITRPIAPPTETGTVLYDATLLNGSRTGPLILNELGSWISYGLHEGDTRVIPTKEIIAFTLGKIVEADQ